MGGFPVTAAVHTAGVYAISMLETQIMSLANEMAGKTREKMAERAQEQSSTAIKGARGSISPDGNTYTVTITDQAGNSTQVSGSTKDLSASAQRDIAGGAGMTQGTLDEINATSYTSGDTGFRMAQSDDGVNTTGYHLEASDDGTNAVTKQTDDSETLTMLALQKAVMEWSILVGVYTQTMASLKDGLSQIARNI